MGTAAPGLVVKDDNARPGLQVVAAIGPKVSFLGFAAAGSSCDTGVSSACSVLPCSKCQLNRSTKGWSATPTRPTHSASVERAKITWLRAAICSRRYTAADDQRMIQVSRSAAGGIAAAVMVSRWRQAYCGRMCRCTKNLAGSTSNCSVTSSLILTKALPHCPQVQDSDS